VATSASVRIIKTIPFKGGTRQTSNRYHFDGTLPPDDTHWHALMDAVVLAEKATMTSSVTIVEAVGYAAGSDVPLSSKVYSTVGTLTPTAGDTNAPGEVAALVRYSTAARSTKNHPIYLFNYYHHVWTNTGAGNGDLLSTGHKNALATYATAWITGFSDGTATHHRCSPNSALATGSIVEEYVTHRDFPYKTSV
jgi:hypothetical protein